MKVLRAFIITLMSTAVVPSALYAQTASVPSQASEQPNVQSGNDIIVTANRRAESLQDVGASVMAFNGEQLENLRVESAGDLAGRRGDEHVERIDEKHEIMRRRGCFAQEGDR